MDKMKYRLLWKGDGCCIRVRLEPEIVRIVNDDGLKQYLQGHPEKAYILAEKLRRTYRSRYGKTLKITTLSLAVEIYFHFLVQELCLLIKRHADRLPFRRRAVSFCDWMIRHMAVIDCGEKECDTNRFVWDAAAAVIPEGLVRKKVKKDG